MGSFLGLFVLPLLLITVSILDWNLISFVNLLLFFALQHTADGRGFNFHARPLVLWSIITFSVLVVIFQVIFDIVWFSNGKDGSMMNWWVKFFGFGRFQPWEAAPAFSFLSVQLLTSFVAFAETYSSLFLIRYSSWWNFFSAVDRLGSHLKVACCLLLPAVQLVVGISNPSWICLPFFICSCVGLVNWSLTSNFLGLFQWWRPLMMYTCFSILLFYLYQLPLELPSIAKTIAEFIGLYKISSTTDWPEILSAACLLLFFFMLSSVKWDLEDMDFILSMQDGSLTERLILPNHYFFIRESRSGIRHTNVLLRGSVFRNFSINYFTYGFPVLLLALSFWSFSFASICAFGLLAYVGYILYAFPSLFHLHKLNGLLLVFILLWAASTYVFNVAFIFLNKTLKKDVEIWETIGLWHYPIPGFFLFAQFCLGVLVSIGNLVNNSVFLYLCDKDEQPSNDDSIPEDKDGKVLAVATVAWALHKVSRAITLVLIFLLVTKPGIIHSIYMVFFLVYLLSHSVSRKVRQALIFLCEAHFVVLYILRLDLIAKALDRSGLGTRDILLELGLLDRAKFVDFLEIGGLLCFCAVQNHGSKMLFSFSAIVQHCPSAPFGFSILKAGVNKSVLLSVYSSSHGNCLSPESSHEHSVASYLSHVEKKCLSLYRSCGTYVAFLTILLAVYLVTPNYISFGYLFFLLFWIIGRQLVEKTKRRLWLPLKIYALLIFIFTYSLGEFSTFQAWLSSKVNLYPEFGFDPKAPLFWNLWESLSILTVMQLYSYERRKSKLNVKPDSFTSEAGLFGFLRRFLIWHSEKILSVAVFYASLTPVSAFGFIYLLGLVFCSLLPKASRLPSKLFLGYTGLLVMLEYLFQLWGKSANMFPGQKHFHVSLLLGFESFDSGFWGLESGLRGKIFVIIACTLQYNVFHWLETLPSSLTNKGKWEDPCHLFVSPEYVEKVASNSNPPLDSSYMPFRRCISTSSLPSFFSNSGKSESSASTKGETSKNDAKKFSFSYIWGSSKESHKWNKKRIASLKKERFEMQMSTLKVYLRFWMENMSNSFSLEINMIALLLASFAILNVISMFYIICLLSCILLKREILCKFWPIYFFCFASVLILEYFAMWKDFIQWPPETVDSNICCRDCWNISDVYYEYCQKCWLGIKIDDQRMLASYYLVFIVSSFKLRSDHLGNFSKSSTYLQMKSQQGNASVWRDLSFDTKSMWTVLDYLRLYCYCHLLDIVLALILITGTLEYDILHLGYLCLALIFFRMRLEILKKKNRIFKYLRIYNFTLIVLSLAYQSPYLGDYKTGTSERIAYLYEVIGFYKYDYGFRITSRSALVEIVIFFLVSMQSFIFASREFNYVFRYLEAEQMGAIVHEQEKKAAWKTAQLQKIHKSEEQKRQRNLQVEKMKAEMLNLKFQLDNINATSRVSSIVSENSLRRRRQTTLIVDKTNTAQDPMSLSGEHDQDDVHSLNQSDYNTTIMQKRDTSSEASPGMQDSPVSIKGESSLAVETLKQSLLSISEISDTEEKDRAHTIVNKPPKRKFKSKENTLLSAVQFIGDGVSQVQSLGNQAVTNIVNFLNIEPDESDSNVYASAEDGSYEEIECQSYVVHGHLERAESLKSDYGTEPVPASLQIGRIFWFVWAQMRSNNDIVCYCCFVLVFLWDFSLLSMVYLAALFLYALLVNSGPSYLFWVIMLIYTEINIMIRYLYQIIIQHSGLSTHMDILRKFGFRPHKITSSFVVSTLPLFLVYLFTLLQRSITAKDGEWASLTDMSFRSFLSEEELLTIVGWRVRILHMLAPIIDFLKTIARCFSRYWISLTQGSESPPYFVQISMRVDEWPLDGIQPERVESALNQLLVAVHEERCEEIYGLYHSPSKARVQSIERHPEHTDVAIAIFEVVYSTPLRGSRVTEWYRSLTPAADVACEIEKARESDLVEQIGFPYAIISVIGGGKREIDLYAYIFCADLAVFFLVAMFYQSVIKNKSQLLDVYQLEDQFPKEFVFVLMVLFFLIVLDRVIYLWSFALGKLVFYLFNLVLFTYWVTEYAWYLQPSHQHVGALALRAIYLTKAVSLALQALQIKNGIPHKSTLYRQFLTSNVSRVNYLGFRLYRALPFLYELRCVLDWSCTSTSLTMYDWLKLEDINASLFLVKCDADLNRARHKQGQKQTTMTKFGSGICLFFILICVIWAPMLIYSSGNPTNIANPILDVTVQIDIKSNGGRLTIYQTRMCKKLPWETIDNNADLDPLRYLEAYNEKDVQLICCQADAGISWLVPDIVLTRFIRSLDHNMQIIFYWIFTRDRPREKEVVKYASVMQSLETEKVDEVKLVLNGTTSRFIMDAIYHRFFRVTGSGDVRYLEQMENSVDVDATLNMGYPPWWSCHDLKPFHVDDCADMAGPMAVVVSEETPQGIIGETLSKFNIWSLYLTFVLAVGRFIRLQCSDLRMRIPFENLPSCERLIAICEDIYAARAEGELEVEEVLYWTLVKIYRSPHMLLEYTKSD